jgi:hypothetical protein
MTPAQHGAAIANAGSGLIREAVQKFDRATQDADRERYNLANMIGTARSKADQRFWLTIAVSIGLFVGFGVFPVVMRAMPFGLDSATAAVIMRANKWDAGMALMKTGNPDGWERLAADADLVSANREKITVCRDAAAKTKKEQHCAITVQAQ